MAVHGSLTVKCSFPIHSGMDNDLFWRFGPSANVKSQIANISKQHLFLSKLMLQIMSDGNKTKYVYCILYTFASIHTWRWKALLTLLCQNAKHAPQQSYYWSHAQFVCFQSLISRHCLASPLESSALLVLCASFELADSVLKCSEEFEEFCSILFWDAPSTDHHMPCLRLHGHQSVSPSRRFKRWQRSDNRAVRSSTCKANIADFIFSWTCKIWTTFRTAHKFSKQFEI